MDVNKQGSIQQFLSGGGELGALIREKNWSETPLGPVENWPQSLKTSVRIMLTSRQPMFVWWGKDLINLYNDAYKSIVGGKHPEALGQPASQVWKEIWHEVQPRVETVMGKNEGTYDEALLLIMERNGYPEETYYTFSYSPVPGDNGGTEGIICANTEDTQRIWGERQLRTLKDLGKSIIDSKTDQHVYDQTITVLKENPHDFPFAAIYQLENNGAVAQLVAQSDENVPEKLLPARADLTANTEAAALLQQVVKTSKTVIVEDAVAKLGKLPTGAWQQPPDKIMLIPILQSGQKIPFAVLKVGLNPYRLLDEKYSSFFRLVADQITTGIVNIRAYEEERKRTEALIELDRAKTTFFSNISHEFRTPLTLMLGPLEEMLNHDTHLPPAGKKNIEATHRNALRLLRLVNTLLDFSRIESGREQALFSPVNLCTLTADLASAFRSVMESAGLKFTVDCENLTGLVYVDKEKWEKIVLNLLSNAFKYTLEGEIHISLSQKNEMVILKVRDTGIGIPEKELPHMFERFHRIENTTGRTHEGTGIGLSLVKELVKMHNGNITVESKEGKGSTFTVTIPLGKEHLDPTRIIETEKTDGSFALPQMYIKEAMSLTGGAQDAPAEETDIIGKLETYTPIHRVLVVDDNADMRDYIQRLLEKKYIVETAANGQQALEKIKAQKPNLVLSDIMMPVMDGIQLLNTLKNNEKTAAIPVILLSARAGEEARIEGFETGADDYLIKPFSAKELLARTEAQIKTAALRNNAEAKWNSLFMQAPIPIAILRGPEFTVELTNKKMLEYWGLMNNDVIGLPAFTVLPDIKEQGFEELLNYVYHTGETIRKDEYPIQVARNGDKKETYANFVFEPLKENTGAISGIMIIGTDITDSVIARKELEESELRFRTVADAAPVMIWMTGTDGLCSFLNYAWTEFSGLGTDEGLGEKWYTLIHPEDFEQMVAEFTAAFAARNEYDIEFRIKDIHGNYRWIADHGRPRYNSAGDFLGYIGICIDIDERKAAKDGLERLVAQRTNELKKINIELENQKEFLESILDSSVDIVAVFDRELRYLAVNKKCCEVYGMSRREMVGQLMPDIFPQTRGNDFSQNVIKTFTDKQIHHTSHQSTITSKYYETYFVPLKDANGEVESVIAIAHDQTEIMEASKKLQKYNEELLNTNQKLEQFAYIASHDLQEPLRKIQIFSDLLKNNISKPDAAEKYLGKISTSAQRMTALIKDVLDYSRLSKAGEEFTTTDLNVLVDNVKADFELLIEQKHAVVTHTQLPVIKGIPLQLHQLFTNLMSNSLKFSSENPVIEITSRTTKAAELKELPFLNPALTYIELIFKDNGIGFDQKYAEQIFDIFHRLHERNTYSGTGIGLALCKKIVENHGGYIHATSQEGKGATFTIYLPV